MKSVNIFNNIQISVCGQGVPEQGPSFCVVEWHLISASLAYVVFSSTSVPQVSQPLSNVWFFMCTMIKKGAISRC